MIDLQNDFMPGGSLPVPDGDAVVPVVNLVMPRFDMVVASQDWHPAGHCASKQDLTLLLPICTWGIRC